MRASQLLPILVVLGAGTGCAGKAPAPACPEPATVEAPPAPPPPEVAPTLTPADDELARLARFVGEWRGEGHGDPGDSAVERSYRWVLGGKYLEVRNRSTYAPQKANPKGEIHEDVGYLSHDKGRKKLVARQFHIEGFVNQYVLESFTADTFVFVSESIENIPAGFRARETLRFTGDDQLEETFEIAPPGKDYMAYSTSKLQRMKQ